MLACLGSCLWRDATEDCEEETAGSESKEGKGVKENLAVVPPVRLKSRCNCTDVEQDEPVDLAGLLAMTEDDADTDDEAVVPTFDLDSIEYIDNKGQKAHYSQHKCVHECDELVVGCGLTL